MQCPYCASALVEGTRSCPSCRSSLYVNCRSCGAEMGALAHECGACGHASAPAPKPPAPPPPVASPRPATPHRNIVLGIVLCIVTCGLWGFVSLWQLADDINARRGRRELNPLLDIVLFVLTCTLWGYYIMYRYPTALAELQRDEGEAESDLVLPCLLLHFFQLGFVGTLIMQSELNRHAERRLAAA